MTALHELITTVRSLSKKSVAASLAFLCALHVEGASAQISETGEEHAPLLTPSSVDSMREVPLWHEMITNLPSDWGRLSVLTFRVGTLPTLAGLTLITGTLIASDKDTWNATRRAYEDSRFVHSVSDVFVSVGDGTYQFGLAAGFAVYGFVASDHRALRTASQTTEAILACGLVVQLLKHISGRESPAVATHDNGAWRFFPSIKEYHSNQSRYYAFPSGHIATGMATLTVLIENYPEATWMKPVGYTTIGLIGVGLVARGYHWYSDLPLGVALGYAFGKLAAHPEGWGSDSGENASTPRFSITPIVTQHGGGIGLALSF